MQACAVPGRIDCPQPRAYDDGLPLVFGAKTLNSMNTRRRLCFILSLVCAAVPAIAQEPETEADSERPAERQRPDLLEGAAGVIDAIGEMEEYLSEQATAEEKLAGDPVTLNPRRCVELALANNSQGKVADADVEASAARVGQAKSGFLPQLSASSSYTHTDFNQKDFTDVIGGGLGGGLGGGGLGGGGGRNPLSILFSILGSRAAGDIGFEPADTFRVDQVKLNQALYAGGQIRAAYEAAKFLRESEEWRRESTLQQIEYDAKQAFFDALATQALVRVAEASISTFERQLYDAEQMFNVGRMSEFEVLSSRTELSVRQAGLVEARNAERLAMANLRRVLALPQDTPLILEPTMEWLPFTLNIDELVAYADANSPALLALDQAILAAEQDVERTKGQFLPRVGANVQYQNAHKGGFTQPDGWTFSIGAEIDLYQGGRRKHEVLEARAQKASAEAQREDLRFVIELGVKQAVIQIRDSLARIQRERTTVGFSRRGLQLAELRFSEGLGTTSQTLDAELALTNAETALVRALRDYAVANAALERAIGKSWRDDVKPLPTGEEEKPEYRP